MNDSKKKKVNSHVQELI